MVHLGQRDHTFKEAKIRSKISLVYSIVETFKRYCYEALIRLKQISVSIIYTAGYSLQDDYTTHNTHEQDASRTQHRGYRMQVVGRNEVQLELSLSLTVSSTNSAILGK